jgi:putative transposase
MKKSPPPIALSDLQWARVRLLIAQFEPAALTDPFTTRAVLSALLYQALTGCPWSDIPANYPPVETVLAARQHWSELGLLRLLSAILLVNLEEDRADLRRFG